MKFLLSLLLPMVVSSQLLGFGASCPSIEMDLQRLGVFDVGTVMAVVHSPEFAFIDWGEADATNNMEDILLDDQYADDTLTATALGVDDSPFVCGGEDLGYVVVSADDAPDGYDQGYDWPQTYDTIQLNPENANRCSCGNMRISVLIAAEMEFPGAFLLDSHELTSVTDPSFARGGFIGLLAQCAECDITGRYPIVHSYDMYAAGFGLDWFEDGDDGWQRMTSDAFLVNFTPIAGSSTSFLSLWALLMGGWF